jgi:predicted dehydrogenase
MGELQLSVGRKLRYGMIGGGPGASIGAVHRRAAALDGDIELVAGAFSTDAGRSVAQGRDLLLSPDRVYGSFADMAAGEVDVSPQSRMDFVVIVTPNDLHFDVARRFLDAGFFVVCDKPLTTTVRDANTLVDLVEKRQALFAVTYNYSGYPMVKQAREMVRSGELGEIRKIVVEYSQGWLTQAIELEGQKQASWRSDPMRGGPALVLGDIGTHAEHLVRYVTGLQVDSVFAELTTFVPGRQLEDDASVLFHCAGGVRGVMLVSQVSVGEENALGLRVYGTHASLEWMQERPNYLIVRPDGHPTQRYARGNTYLCDAAKAASRLPPGHPEGFIEAFANVYADFARDVSARLSGSRVEDSPQYPTVHDGMLGVKFVRAALESHRTGGWVDVMTDCGEDE